MELNKMICLVLFSLTFVLFWDSDKPNIDQPCYENNFQLWVLELTNDKFFMKLIFSLN